MYIPMIERAKTGFSSPPEIHYFFLMGKESVRNARSFLIYLFASKLSEGAKVLTEASGMVSVIYRKLCSIKRK